MLGFIALPVAGCSGINAGGSVSPATFLIPGVRATPPPPAVPVGVAMAGSPSPLAQAR